MSGDDPTSDEACARDGIHPADGGSAQTVSAGANSAGSGSGGGSAGSGSAGDTSAGVGADLLLCLIPFIAGVALFLPTLNFDFIFDDTAEMLNFDGLFTPGEWHRLLVRAQYGLYRPVKYLSLHFDHARGGWDPAPFHLTNIILHGAVASLVYVFLRVLSGGRSAALVGALYFALHPIHVEPVAWISSRGSMLSAIGVLGVAISYLRGRSAGTAARRAGWWGMMVLSAVFGFLSKEDALMILPTLVAIELWGGMTSSKPGRTWPAVSLGSLGCVAAAYIILRQSILGQVAQGEWSHGLAGVVSTLPGILLRYLGQMVLPLGMTLEYPIDYSGGFGARFVLQAVTLLSLIVLVSVPRLRAPDSARLSLAWFLLFLAPAMGFIPINSPAADRYLYTASIGGAIFATWLWGRFERLGDRPRRLLILATALTAVLYSFMARDYMSVWRNEESLWTHVLERNDRSWLGWNNLAAENNRRGEHEQALRMADNALRLRPDYIEALITRGRALGGLRRGAEAEACFVRAVSLNPANPVALHMLADHLDRAERPQEALVQYNRLFEVQPGNATARNAAAIIEILAGNREAAIAHWEAALRANPGHEVSRRNLDRAQSEAPEK